MNSQQHRQAKASGRRRLRKNTPNRYPIEASPFWRLTSIHTLAKLIDVPVQELESVCMAPTYNEFDEQLKPGSKPGKVPRRIQEPTEQTLRIHYRLVKHLDCIRRPDFLHSATKKRSHVTNARAHVDTGGSVVAMDIRKFFENTLYAHVKQFFVRDLGCSPDIARLLSNVCTARGHLPTGSCISPLLSYLCHRGMFAAIEKLCGDADVTMTLYVDDVTLSGTHATKTLLYQVKSIIKRHGLETQPTKDAVIKAGKAAIITGVVREEGKLRLRNKHHDAIVTLQDVIVSGDDRPYQRLRGQLAAARSVEPAAAIRLSARLERLLRGGDL